MKLVLIEWEDALGVGSSWGPLEDLVCEPIICRSVGWIAAESKRAIVLIPNVHDGDESRNVSQNGCGDMTIPKSAIRRMKRLRG